MQQSITFAYLAAVATYLLPATTAALGINCRGSGLCGLATFTNNAPVSIAQALSDAVKNSSKDPSTVFADGEHIICVTSTLPVTIEGGAEAEGASATIGVSGNFSPGGVCMFLQGASLTLEQIRPLAEAIVGHGCNTCGSVPIHFVDQGSNDPSSGILTINYVDDPSCIGNCLSASGGATRVKSRMMRG